MEDLPVHLTSGIVAGPHLHPSRRVRTTRVGTSTPVKLTAIYNGSSKPAKLTVTPSPVRVSRGGSGAGRAQNWLSCSVKAGDRLRLPQHQDAQIRLLSGRG